MHRIVNRTDFKGLMGFYFILNTPGVGVNRITASMLNLTASMANFSTVDVSDCGKLKFKIYGKEDIKKALTNLDRHDAWNEVLHAIDVDTDSPGYKLFKSYFIRPKFPSHLRPEPIAELTNVVSGSNSEQLYLENEAHGLRICQIPHAEWRMGPQGHQTGWKLFFQCPEEEFSCAIRIYQHTSKEMVSFQNGLCLSRLFLFHPEGAYC